MRNVIMFSLICVYLAYIVKLDFKEIELQLNINN